MNTGELIKVINNIPMKGEVCAKDLLPEEKPLGMKAYIVKTDISIDPGEHWVGYLLQKRSSYLLRFIWKTTRRAICSTISLKKLYKMDP